MAAMSCATDLSRGAVSPRRCRGVATARTSAARWAKRWARSDSGMRSAKLQSTECTAASGSCAPAFHGRVHEFLQRAGRQVLLPPFGGPRVSTRETGVEVRFDSAHAAHVQDGVFDRVRRLLVRNAAVQDRDVVLDHHVHAWNVQPVNEWPDRRANAIREDVVGNIRVRRAARQSVHDAGNTCGDVATVACQTRSQSASPPSERARRRGDHDGTDGGGGDAESAGQEPCRSHERVSSRCGARAKRARSAERARAGCAAPAPQPGFPQGLGSPSARAGSRGTGSPSWLPPSCRVPQSMLPGRSSRQGRRSPRACRWTHR